ncbi:hypothetical protein MPSEU_000022200 [Mayamaea pseudoterrestris]|nr:hypothetical protein MPSEU_000022200 [Mayamaea pseudoterrestris]
MAAFRSISRSCLSPPSRLLRHYKYGSIDIGNNAIRHFTPMTKEEEEAEKHRVASLTPFQKDQELRKLNRKIATLDMMRGINTGELYTWRGRYKQLYREYGMPFMVYYACCWAATGLTLFGLIEFGAVDTTQWLETIDSYMNWNLASRVDPQFGKIGMVVVLNELIDPIRLPIVILTVKPVVDRLYPPKY